MENRDDKRSWAWKWNTGTEKLDVFFWNQGASVFPGISFWRIQFKCM